MLYTLTTQDYETSSIDTRENLTLAQAYKMAQGGYYKAQVINDYGIIEYEFKGI